jgi:pyruvate kinase
MDEDALPSVQVLADRIAALAQAVEEAAEAVLAGWEPALLDPAYRPSARNLARYLALRRHDLTGLQPALAAYGLSSLGRCEAHVGETLAALSATLACLAGRGPCPPAPVPPPPAPLKRMSEVLFGRHPAGHATRIMATLPTEAAGDPTLVAALIAAGMDCARINCAHDGPEIWAAMVGHVRAAAAAAGRECKVLMDIAGPKLRLAAVAPEDAPRLKRGERFALVADLATRAPGDPPGATLAQPEILALLAPGMTIWVDDGKLGARVVEVGPSRAVLEVTHAREKGKRLKPEKGLNLPGVAVPIPPLTEKDLADLDHVARLADAVGFSFVQRPEDVALLSRELDARRPGLPKLPIVLKIETALAVRNLPRLIVQGAGERPLGVMIARGDLAVEIGFPRLSEIQEEILWVCEAAHVPVIWATEVFASLVAEGRPSRAETTDAAMAARAECVMLNKGPHLVEAVETMADVLRRMDRHLRKKTARLSALSSWPLEGLSLHPPQDRP